MRSQAGAQHTVVINLMRIAGRIVLRNEVIACLGDFVGLRPTKLAELPDDPESPEIWWAILHPTDPIAAFALSDGSILLRDLYSIKNIARFDGEYSPRGLCFASTGNTLLSLHMPKAFTSEQRPADAVARLFARTQDGTWIQSKIVKVPGARQCISTRNGFYIGIVDETSHVVRIVQPMDGNVVHEFEYPEQFQHPERSEGIPILDIAPDGHSLAVAIADPNNSQLSVVEIWDLTTKRYVTRLKTDLSACTGLNFSSDGRCLAFLSQSGGII